MERNPGPLSLVQLLFLLSKEPLMFSVMHFLPSAYKHAVILFMYKQKQKPFFTTPPILCYLLFPIWASFQEIFSYSFHVFFFHCFEATAVRFSFLPHYQILIQMPPMISMLPNNLANFQPSYMTIRIIWESSSKTPVGIATLGFVFLLSRFSSNLTVECFIFAGSALSEQALHAGAFQDSVSGYHLFLSIYSL